ncbi:MAG: NADPH-dependent F420 reductase [Actinomycetota bacterium]
MRIGIIGTGGMATGFARGLVDEHDVRIGSRDPGRGKQTASELGAAGGGTYEDAARDAEVVILAVPWTAVDETLLALGDVSGRVVLDITNPYTAQGNLEPLDGTSTAEEIQKKLPGASVVKGWNHVFSAVLEQPEIDGIRSSVMIAGDNQRAKETVFDLARDLGFEPFDVGGLEATRSLEVFQLAQPGLGFYPDTAIRILKPS